MDPRWALAHDRGVRGRPEGQGQPADVRPEQVRAAPLPLACFWDSDRRAGLLSRPLRKTALARICGRYNAQCFASSGRKQAKAVLDHILRPVRKKKRCMSVEKNQEIVIIIDEDEIMMSSHDADAASRALHATRAAKKPTPEDALEIVNLLELNPKIALDSVPPGDEPFSEHERLVRKEMFGTKMV
ncbi:hypothetical protein HWV62_10078 [Athelia sp. TMB]|nr:hypothetical protein HWV62_10078 [Athelia sp. TMB]